MQADMFLNGETTVTFRRSKSAGMAWLAVEQDREKFVIYGTESQIANFATSIRDALPAETQEDPEN